MSRKKKSEIRGEMRRVLANLDRRWLQAAGRELCRNLSTVIDTRIDREVEHILAWVHFFPGEVDLSSFINEHLDKRRIYLPQLRGETMQFISVGKDWLVSMEEGTTGIPEPSQVTGEVFSAENASRAAIIVPGLAFDSSGGRLGRGKGYYDRFLGRSRMFDITKIGVCWSLQMLSEIPTESHDSYMDWVITEETVVPVTASSL